MFRKLRCNCKHMFAVVTNQGNKIHERITFLHSLNERRCTKKKMKRKCDSCGSDFLKMITMNKNRRSQEEINTYTLVKKTNYYRKFKIDIY